MRQAPIWLSAGLLVGSGMAAEPPGPSIDLLLYLADWTPDQKGRLTDPLEVPDMIDRRADVPYAGDDAPPYPEMEPQR